MAEAYPARNPGTGEMAILTLNAGSSSLKFGLFDVEPDGTMEQRVRGVFESLSGTPRFSVKDATGRLLVDKSLATVAPPTEVLLRELIMVLEPILGGKPVEAVGHRIVHGGSRFVKPTRLTDDILKELEALTPIAPLHQPASLRPVKAFLSLRPDIPQIGCFDTAFHSTLKPPANRYAIPREYEEMGIRRYGFHGLSYEFIATRLAEISPELAAKKTVAAHLGAGCSLCAMQNGKSIDTTMGFTALDGLMMATRSGAIDPGIILYLQQALGLSAGDVEQLLYYRSGLLGVSGISGDVRMLLASDNPHAAEALDLFTFRIAQDIAAMATTMEGLESLVFTAGVGEHATSIREAICHRLQWLGVKLDKSADGGELISSPDSAVEVRVIPTNEEMTIARQAHALVTVHKRHRFAKPIEDEGEAMR
ncbi:acetate kinase [Mesorhizobium soli]|uniref:acetate/propionate family kinase n=1 Tax=Pseudaminobacter soli (ex Li et al. 2025) TaxID=1295366 RepID=UPI002472EF17|nr:acetate/propionate family kinase [Mesorhizobium soli]MDH6233565.1 acetate kinase [Mesorhizobium soli]